MILPVLYADVHQLHAEGDAALMNIAGREEKAAKEMMQQKGAKEISSKMNVGEEFPQHYAPTFPDDRKEPVLV